MTKTKIISPTQDKTPTTLTITTDLKETTESQRDSSTVLETNIVAMMKSLNPLPQNLQTIRNNKEKVLREEAMR